MFGEPGKTFYADKPMTDIHLVRLGVAEHPDLQDAYFSMLMSESPSLDVLHATEGAPATTPPAAATVATPPAAALPPAAASVATPPTVIVINT